MYEYKRIVRILPYMTVTLKYGHQQLPDEVDHFSLWPMNNLRDHFFYLKEKKSFSWSKTSLTSEQNGRNEIRLIFRIFFIEF